MGSLGPNVYEQPNRVHKMEENMDCAYPQNRVCFMLIVLSPLVTLCIGRLLIAQSGRTEHVRTRRILTEPLAPKTGTSLELVEVTLGPASHTVERGSNGCRAVVYVADGTVQVEATDRSDQTGKYGPSSAFSEPPGLTHAVYRNASQDSPGSLSAGLGR